MPVDSFPLPDAAGAPIATPSHDSAVQRKRRLAFIAGVVVVVRGTALSRRFGGAR
jgi:hypothetical protein